MSFIYNFFGLFSNSIQTILLQILQVAVYIFDKVFTCRIWGYFIQQCTHCIIKWVDKSEIQKAYMKRTFAVHWHLNSILNCFLTVMRVMFVEYFPNVVPFFNEIILGCLFSKLSQMAFSLISNINYLGCFTKKSFRE